MAVKSQTESDSDSKYDSNSGFRSAMELYTYKQSLSPLKYVHPTIFSHKIDLRYYTWDPSDLARKIKENIPLRFADYCSPFLMKYSDWLEQICFRYRTATALELLAILSKQGRVSIGQYKIWL